jgi:hypothetical protein
MKEGVAVAQSVWRLATGWKKKGSCSLLHVSQIGFRAHPASYTMGSGLKREGRQADNSSPTSAEVKKTWILQPLPHTSSWCGA